MKIEKETKEYLYSFIMTFIINFILYNLIKNSNFYKYFPFIAILIWIIILYVVSYYYKNRCPICNKRLNCEYFAHDDPIYYCKCGFEIYTYIYYKKYGEK